MSDYFCKRNLYQVFIAGNVGYKSLLVTLFYLLMCVRFHMGQKSQCHIYPGLTGKLVKLMSKVRYIIIIWKALAMAKRPYLASIWKTLTPSLLWVAHVTCRAESRVYLFTQQSQIDKIKIHCSEFIKVHWGHDKKKTQMFNYKFCWGVNHHFIPKMCSYLRFRNELFYLKVFP